MGKKIFGIVVLNPPHIIYWQAKEITRIIEAYGHELDEKCLTMIPHISPIGWDNVILYGEYVLDLSLIK